MSEFQIGGDRVGIVSPANTGHPAHASGQVIVHTRIPKDVSILQYILTVTPRQEMKELVAGQPNASKFPRIGPAKSPASYPMIHQLV